MKQHPPGGPYDGRRCDNLTCPCWGPPVKTLGEHMNALKMECFNLWSLLSVEAKELLTFIASGWKAWCLMLILFGSVILAAYGLRALVGV